MDQLFKHYERELQSLRTLSREYAQRYPKVAARLQLGGDSCDDPHVERLIQAVALLSARVAKRLDDSHAQFTEALLNLLFPHYLRPFPSCAIARLPGQHEPGAADIPALPRGTRLESAPVNGVPCTFKTVYDVAPASVVLAEAHFSAPMRAPIDLRPGADITAALTLHFVAAQPGLPLHRTGIRKVRVYIDADASFSSALRDALFIHARQAYVQCGENGPWSRLPGIPVAAAGFDVDDALIPFDARSHQAYRILAEYFAFPEKFNFIDIDIAALLAQVPETSTGVTLHLALAGMNPDDDKARMLAGLSQQHLLQGCTPVINLFEQAGVPIAHSLLSADYTVLAHGNHPHAFDLHSVERVHLVRQCGKDAVASEFLPFYALQHAPDQQHARYWLMRRDEALALCSPGHENAIALIDADGDPFAVQHDVLSIDLRCTNRDLPCTLRIGAAGGDLFIPGSTLGGAIRLLRRPTRPAPPPDGTTMHWRLISHLSLNHHSLALEGAAGLREMLTLYDPAPSAVSRRQIAGVADLAQCETTAWIRHRRGSSLVHGTEIRLTLDEEAYAGAGMYLFVQVLDRFFGLYVHLNSFVELIILSQQSGKELFRCPPRSGNMRLV